MKAIIIRANGGPEVLRYEDVADPTPGPGEVVVRVKAVALNHLDLWIRRGVPGAPFHLPAITGADVSGEVHSVGVGVTDLELGSPVMVAPGISCGVCVRCVGGADHLCSRYGILGETCDGGMAELVKVPREHRGQARAPVPPRGGGDVADLPDGLAHAGGPRRAPGRRDGPYPRGG